jgi:outer membrane protein
MLPPFFWIVVAGLLCACCSEAFAAGETASRRVPRGWQAGGIALVSNGGYAGSSSRQLVVPAVAYEGERVFLRGLQLGWHAWQRDDWRLDLVAQARLDGFDADDIPLDGLRDRRGSMDVGAVLTRSSRQGNLELTVLSDALSRSRGQELALQYGYPLRLGKWRLTPSLGVRWWSHRLADYYYGIRPAETADGAPGPYAVPAVLVPEAGFNAVVPLGRRWMFWSALKYQHLPAAITDSPLVQRSSASTVLVGVVYSF